MPPESMHGNWLWRMCMQPGVGGAMVQLGRLGHDFVGGVADETSGSGLRASPDYSGTSSATARRAVTSTEKPSSNAETKTGEMHLS